MYERIIVGFDGSDEAADALAFGRLVAQSTGGALLLAHVAAAAESARADEAELRDVAQASGGESVLVPDGSPVRGLRELALERGAGLIVVGSTGRAGLGTVLLGSVGQRLLEGSPCAVAVAPRGLRGREPEEPRVVAVGFDGSPEAALAVKAAAELAMAAGATIRLIAVQPPSDIAPPTLLPDELRRARDALPSELRAAAHLLHGPPAGVIADEAEKGVDVLFVGSRGQGPLRRAMLGSVSSMLMASVACPVVVTPRGADPEAAEADVETQ